MVLFGLALFFLASIGGGYMLTNIAIAGTMGPVFTLASPAFILGYIIVSILIVATVATITPKEK
jgi:hypothetical protein